jgi:hypothetical protein
MPTRVLYEYQIIPSRQLPKRIIVCKAYYRAEESRRRYEEEDIDTDLDEKAAALAHNATPPQG